MWLHSQSYPSRANLPTGRVSQGDGDKFQSTETPKTAIVIRHSKYLNNLIEQDHRAVKRLVRPMLEFKSFWAARCTIAGIEVMHAIRKGQLGPTGTVSPTPAEQFYALAA